MYWDYQKPYTFQNPRLNALGPHKSATCCVRMDLACGRDTGASETQRAQTRRATSVRKARTAVAAPYDGGGALCIARVVLRATARAAAISDARIDGEIAPATCEAILSCRSKRSFSSSS